MHTYVIVETPKDDENSHNESQIQLCRQNTLKKLLINEYISKIENKDIVTLKILLQFTKTQIYRRGFYWSHTKIITMTLGYFYNVQVNPEKALSLRMSTC